MKKQLLTLALVLGASFGVYHNIHAQEALGNFQEAPERPQYICKLHADITIDRLKTACTGANYTAECIDEVYDYGQQVYDNCCKKSGQDTGC